ncbi:recombinase family protein [Amycolatopsis pigmentata]|uniref:Recombinase family protein n=1 Tax=Amycolatopsis pigmentata TaxID=450801 RepID=A0ABW5FS18_9PSEU
MLAAMRDPGRGFDAVVVGEPQRAFYGNQYGLTFPVFVHYGVGLWVPEVGEGRFLGGRPPYGYRLADAGPHPNPAKAADGKRLHRLEPDPATAPVVRRIFAEYLAGRGIFAIAEGLTRDGVTSPSASDPGRNRHRSGVAWSKGAILVILSNPRYTGRQVWNKQRKEEVYRQLRLHATYHPGTRIVRIETTIDPDGWGYGKWRGRRRTISPASFIPLNCGSIKDSAPSCSWGMTTTPGESVETRWRGRTGTPHIRTDSAIRLTTNRPRPAIGVGARP